VSAAPRPPSGQPHDEQPFAYAIRNGGGKLRVGSMVVAAEYSDTAEATARRIEGDVRDAIKAAVAAERERCARIVESYTNTEPDRAIAAAAERIRSGK
jgi:hypothetical protein